MAIMEKLSPQRLQQAAGRPLPRQDERPAGEPARHSNLPLEIRRKVDPHYSQWYVVPAREAQRRRPNEFLKFFRHTRRGGWTETADPHLAQPGEEVIALERPGTGESHPYQLTLTGDGYRMVRHCGRWERRVRIDTGKERAAWEQV